MIIIMNNSYKLSKTEEFVTYSSVNMSLSLHYDYITDSVRFGQSICLLKEVQFVKK